MQKIAITGASGFVGTELGHLLKKHHYEVIQIKRSDLQDVRLLSLKLTGVEAVINLAGANIIQRWSDSYKKVLYRSRIDTTKMLVEAISLMKQHPKTLISTSAIGIYKNNKHYDEYSNDHEENFLAKLCLDWESEAQKAKELGVRTLIFRYGIILSQNGGALQKMLLPFKLGVGGIIGDGKQAFSFIHIEDLKRFYLHALEQTELQGIYNMTTEEPTTNYGLTKALGQTLKRPTILPLPAFVLQLLFGEGSTVLTDGQSVVPKRVLESGFKFKFATIEEVLEDLLA
ncbi:TIGR01777 family oxidoreductase [bacterium]|nr:TIGR01777 family oxidoreductase [bacterium]MBU1958722.1 TIGR01777 family oxidoreductase [bacterium]